MSKERRRYFRIVEAVGISYKVIDGEMPEQADVIENHDTLSSANDARIEQLLGELGNSDPKVAELLALFNLKLERLAGRSLMDNELVNRIAQRVKEANISACGIAFINEEPINEGARLALELKLYPDESHISTQGRVVGCDNMSGGRYYWRIDFIGMTQSTQELLIQHVVRNQSAQLKARRDSKAGT